MSLVITVLLIVTYAEGKILNRFFHHVTLHIYRAAVAAAAAAQAAGMGMPVAIHGSGYVQPEIVVTPPPLSAVLNQPSPGATVALAVNVGGGKVTTEPVDVYKGSSGTSVAAGNPLREAGGHAPYNAVALADMVPAPAPPVCQGR